jgi:hypothetical protein
LKKPNTKKDWRSGSRYRPSSNPSTMKKKSWRAKSPLAGWILSCLSYLCLIGPSPYRGNNDLMEIPSRRKEQIRKYFTIKYDL